MLDSSFLAANLALGDPGSQNTVEGVTIRRLDKMQVASFTNIFCRESVSMYSPRIWGTRVTETQSLFSGNLPSVGESPISQ